MYYHILSLLVCSISSILTMYHFLFNNEWFGLFIISVISVLMVWDSYENNPL